MKAVLEYIEYFSACLNAITKGAKVARESWPVVSPFSHGTNKDSGDEPKE